MKKSHVVFAMFLAFLWMVPTAEADPRVNARGRVGRDRAGASSHTSRSPIQTRGHFVHRGVGPHRFAPRHLVPFGVVIAPPLAVYSSPPAFYAPPPFYGTAGAGAVVTAPPMMYGGPAYAPPAPAPPAPSQPRIVEYPTGRYELRGDGVGTPHIWVWIPNPPPPPAPPASGEAPPTNRSPVFRWVDEHGVVHWTNRAETIPPRYRQSS